MKVFLDSGSVRLVNGLDNNLKLVFEDSRLISVEIVK